MYPSNFCSDVARFADEFLESLATRPVGARVEPEELRRRFATPLPEAGSAPHAVLTSLVADLRDALTASAGPRYFGFVIGGTLPAALGADWLASAWDQNGGLYAASPAASVVEDVAASWVVELLGLAETTSVGLVTGGQMANFTGLAAARQGVLTRAGWDLERDGLQGAPEVHVVVSAAAHATIFKALKLLGFGLRQIRTVEADAQGRQSAEALAAVLADCDGPTIVCAQAGNVNTGSFDPLAKIIELAHGQDAWVHVDGAFGLWAAVSPALRHLVAGFEQADSWATDAHKWLNVPYDSGLVLVADRAAHRAAMALSGSYLVETPRQRDSQGWGPESSRRARGFALYAVLKSLGRHGVIQLIERSCELARRMAKGLDEAPCFEVLNDVVLNQVLVRFQPPSGEDPDKATRGLLERIQQEGTCWFGPTTQDGRTVLRISVSNWATDPADIDRSVEAILRCAGGERG